MARFRGTVQGNRGITSRLGHKTSGLSTVASGWHGEVCTFLYVNSKGQDCYRVTVKDQNGGIREKLAGQLS